MRGRGDEEPIPFSEILAAREENALGLPHRRPQDFPSFEAYHEWKHGNRAAPLPDTAAVGYPRMKGRP